MFHLFCGYRGVCVFVCVYMCVSDSKKYLIKLNYGR